MISLCDPARKIAFRLFFSMLYSFKVRSKKGTFIGGNYKGDACVVNAVIVAEGDLHIRGKGKISGSVITKGKLTLDEDIKVTYSKSTVAHIVQQYSRWRLAENSWYDFAVTEN